LVPGQRSAAMHAPQARVWNPKPLAVLLPTPKQESKPENQNRNRNLKTKTQTHGSAFSLTLGSHSSSPTSAMLLTFSQILSSFPSANQSRSHFANFEAFRAHQRWQRNHMMAWPLFKWFSMLFSGFVVYHYCMPQSTPQLNTPAFPEDYCSVFPFHPHTHIIHRSLPFNTSAPRGSFCRTSLFIFRHVAPTITRHFFPSSFSPALLIPLLANQKAAYNLLLRASLSYQHRWPLDLLIHRRILYPFLFRCELSILSFFLFWLWMKTKTMNSTF